MSRINPIQHQGKKILYLDFSGLDKQGILDLCTEAKATVAKKPPKSLLTLSNFTGIHFDNESTKAVQDLAKHDEPYVKAGAVVGITGLLMVVYNTMMTLTGRKFEMFSDETKAKDWLAQQ